MTSRPTFSRPPLVLAWETTRQCYLHCQHCRGNAENSSFENELSTTEGEKLIQNLACSFPSAMLILTGGEPMYRSDIWHLASFASHHQLQVVMAPCGHLINDQTAEKIIQSHILRISLSLDGPDAESHDRFRGVQGAWEGTIRGIECARKHHISFQINSTISKLNASLIPKIHQLALSLGADVLDLFFLVPTGRGAQLREIALSAQEQEKTLREVQQLAHCSPIPIRVTCAPYYSRITHNDPLLPPTSARGCMAGKGFLFVSHQGIVQPCGFLDLPCGNLRHNDFDLAEIYHHSPLLSQLRDPDQLSGHCFLCKFRHSCGGCRARAFADSANPMTEDPGCFFVNP